jgi:hypothetical protein
MSSDTFVDKLRLALRSPQQVRAIVHDNGLAEMFFHAEEACYPGRFAHRPQSPSA